MCREEDFSSKTRKGNPLELNQSTITFFEESRGKMVRPCKNIGLVFGPELEQFITCEPFRDLV